MVDDFSKELEDLSDCLRREFKDEKKITDGDVCHYTSPQGLKGILESSSLWFSDIDHLNDGSERRHTYELLKEMTSGKDPHPFYEKCLKKFATYMEQTGEINPAYYVASFSKHPDSLSLWNYYTKKPDSMGYAIQFNANNLIECIRAQVRSIKDRCGAVIFYGRTIYDDETKKNLLEKTLSCFKGIYSKHPHKEKKTKIYKRFLAHLRFLSLFLKDKAFENEGECRIIVRVDMSKIIGIKNKEKKDREEKSLLKKIGFREYRGLLIPYIGFSFDKKAVHEIKISPTQKDVIAEIGLKKALKCFGYQSDISLSKINLRY